MHAFRHDSLEHSQPLGIQIEQYLKVPGTTYTSQQHTCSRLALCRARFKDNNESIGDALLVDRDSRIPIRISSLAYIFL